MEEGYGMKKKNMQKTALLVATGVLITGGAWSLGVTMTRAENAEVTTQAAITATATETPETEKVDMVTDQIKEPSKKPLRKEDSKNLSKSKLTEQEQKEIQKAWGLPQDAIVISKEKAECSDTSEYEYHVFWNHFYITVYYPGIKGYKMKKDTDISMITAIQKSIAEIKKLTGKDVSGGKVLLGRGVNKVKAKRAYHMLLSLDKDGDYWSICDDKENERLWSVSVSAVTGEINSYSDYSDRGAVQENEADSLEGLPPQELNEIGKEYNAIATNFVEHTLKKGKVEKCFGMSSYNEIRSNGYEPIITLYCKTEEGDVIEISINQINKTVFAYDMDPITP